MDLEPRLSPFAGVAEHHRHPLEELPADRAVLLDERTEVPVRQPVAGKLGRRDDRRHARALIDQGDHAEIVAGLQGRAFLAADEHCRFAGLDDEEGRATRYRPRQVADCKSASNLDPARTRNEVIGKIRGESITVVSGFKRCDIGFLLLAGCRNQTFVCD